MPAAIIIWNNRSQGKLNTCWVLLTLAYLFEIEHLYLRVWIWTFSLLCVFLVCYLPFFLWVVYAHVWPQWWVLLLCQPGCKPPQSIPQPLTGHVLFKRSFVISRLENQNKRKHKNHDFILALASDVDFELDLVPVSGSSRSSDVFLHNHNHVW